MLGGEVGAVQAALPGPGVALLQADLVVVAVVHPHLEDALDVHLLDVFLAQPVLDPEQLVEHRVVEALGAQQADVQLDGPAHLADLAVPHDRPDGGLAAHAHQRQLLQPPLGGLGVGHGVGRVGVAAAGGGQHLVAVGGHAGDGLPAGGLALQVRHQGAVDDAVLQAPDEDGRHQPAVLADVVDEVVAGPGQDDVLVDPRHLVVVAAPPEEVLVGLGFPGPEAGAGPGAGGAALHAVDAVVEAEFLLQVERVVLAGLVAVADHVVRAGDDAAGAAGAQPAGDDLLVELLPLEGPAGLLGGRRGGRRRGCCGVAHGSDGTAGPVGGRCGPPGASAAVTPAEPSPDSIRARNPGGGRSHAGAARLAHDGQRFGVRGVAGLRPGGHPSVGGEAVAVGVARLVAGQPEGGVGHVAGQARAARQG